MATTHPATRLSTGEIIGRSTGRINRYLGIPFAAPPWGEHRFALPQPAAAWSEPRDCAEFDATSPQTPYSARMGEILASVDIEGENMLTANVWSPDGANDLPVVLWLHGGAFERGGAAIELYDGTTFARDGVVFVSINYRLGSEGFSVLEGVPRNLGLEDAAAGLRWVHAEIAAFGGDPKRITIMGESAGGALVAALLSRPERELVVGAIVQSGPLSAEPEKRARRVTDRLAKRLGVPPTREAFMNVPPHELLRVRSEQMAGKTILDGVPSFVLCIDQASLPEPPTVAVPRAEVPLLIGTNTEEYSLWFSPEALAKTNRLRFFIVRKVLKVPGAAVKEYKQTWQKAGLGEVLGQIITDLVFRGPAVRAARLRKAPTYVYEFSWPTKVKQLGATHALEIGFVFDALGKDGGSMVSEDAPQALADRMHADWVQFIKQGKIDGWRAFGEHGQVRRYDSEVTEGPLPRKTALDALLRAL